MLYILYIYNIVICFYNIFFSIFICNHNKHNILSSIRLDCRHIKNHHIHEYILTTTNNHSINKTTVILFYIMRRAMLSQLTFEMKLSYVLL